MTRAFTKRAALCLAGLVLLGAATVPLAASAQAPADFSGHWTVTSAGGGRGGDSAPAVGSGWGPDITIMQKPDTLMVERIFFVPGDLQPPLKYRYALDGSESRNTVLMGRGIQEQVSTATWEGDTLVIVTQYIDPDADGGRGVATEVRQTLRYQRAGYPAYPPLLVIETTRGGAFGGAPSTTRTVYQQG